MNNKIVSHYDLTLQYKTTIDSMDRVITGYDWLIKYYKLENDYSRTALEVEKIKLKMISMRLTKEEEACLEKEYLDLKSELDRKREILNNYIRTKDE